MNSRENPIYGRKVFFLNPPFAIEKKVIEKLKDAEYEVYVLDDYVFAKSVLKKFPDAICFINIDQQLTLKGWFNFIKSFEADPELKSIFLGIMSVHTKEESVNKFLMNVKLPGGYVKLTGVSSEEALKQFTGILEINGAKGKRKFLSLTCEKDDDTLNGYIAFGSKLYAMSFENISSIGITCKLPIELGRQLKTNMVLDNVSLALGRWSVIAECVVYSLRVLNNNEIAILLFTKKTTRETRASIRKFIYEVLNKRIDTIIQYTEDDSEDYTISKDYGNTDSVPDYNAPTDNEAEEPASVEEVEEAPETENNEKKSEEESKSEKEEKTEEK